ncbi:hypothetical protein ACFVP3_23765 [Streptomyces sp. NPDC057806]|uniref:hypothetical protein n=1 Tax=Streptomyces sp. NPDC057806 TaxID=3346255 RepID=UPI0036B55D9F
MPRRKTTPTPASVWDAVPGVVQAEKLLKDTAERLAALPPALSPEDAQQAVIDAAVDAMRTDGAPIPADIGERAAAARMAALAPYAERLACHTAASTLRRRLPFLKSRGSRIVLEALGTQLDDVLTEVRTIVERSGHLDGDSAIEAGDQGIADYKRLRELVGVVDELRRVQRSVYAETADRGVLASLYREGHDQFRGVRAEPLPADVRAVVEGRKGRDVPFLIFMAESGRAWLPVDVEELTDEARDAESVGTPDDGRNPFWQRETTTQEPSAPRRSRI